MTGVEELKQWLISQGESAERAEQIVTNHYDEVNAAMDAWKLANEPGSSPDAPAEG